MYQLTLTHSERAAIDWVGNRYAHGHELFVQLWCHSTQQVVFTEEKDELNWDDPDPITFYIPENVAWRIKELIEQDNLACFNHELRVKLEEFRDSIV